MRVTCFLVMILAGCGGLAWDTKVAEQFPVRLAMMASVEPGVTTETGFATRWGNPTQKVREGAQTEFIYRSTANPKDDEVRLLRYGDSAEFVIVTFQYGLATGVRSSDTEVCRSTFPPQPPGPGYDTPATVYATGDCIASAPQNVTNRAFRPGGKVSSGGKLN